MKVFEAEAGRVRKALIASLMARMREVVLMASAVWKVVGVKVEKGSGPLSVRRAAGRVRVRRSMIIK